MTLSRQHTLIRCCAPTLAIGLLVTACGDIDDRFPLTEIHGATMGTTYSVKVVDLPEALPPATLKRVIDRRLQEINSIMSTYLADSELSRFNASRSTQWQPVSAELVTVVRTALEISTRTKGAFDVTVGPLVDLWGFGPGQRLAQPPTPEVIRRERSKVGYERLHARETPSALKKDLPELHVDLSAIAKGHGVDAIARILDENGLKNFLVEIGGEVWGKGHNARGTPWKIAVETPDLQIRSVHTVIEISDMGVATSGDYRNYFEREGQRYSHTIDPQTGRPIVHRTASVTVIRPAAMEADAWATALLVLGSEQGRLLAQDEELAAFFIDRDKQGFVATSTGAFTRYLSDPPR